MVYAPRIKMNHILRDLTENMMPVKPKQCFSLGDFRCNMFEQQKETFITFHYTGWLMKRSFQVIVNPI